MNDIGNEHSPLTFSLFLICHLFILDSSLICSHFVSLQLMSCSSFHFHFILKLSPIHSPPIHHDKLRLSEQQTENEMFAKNEIHVSQPPLQKHTEKLMSCLHNKVINKQRRQSNGAGGVGLQQLTMSKSVLHIMTLSLQH